MSSFIVLSFLYLLSIFFGFPLSRESCFGLYLVVTLVNQVFIKQSQIWIGRLFNISRDSSVLFRLYTEKQEEEKEKEGKEKITKWLLLFCKSSF